jgi:hypothetical protein
VTENGNRPERKPVLDLDTLEREGGSPEPFDFVLDGRRFILSDPKEIDWQDLIAAMRSPILFFKMVLPADDQKPFFAAKIPAWKMNALMTGYQDHYGLPGQGEAGALLA